MPGDDPSVSADGAKPRAFGGIRVCDFSGQLAGAGATRYLAAMGAEVIRVEDPVTQGYWDALRGVPPFIDERRGTDFGGPFNNHNVEKLGLTLNLRTEKGRDLLRELIAVSDAVTENFAPGVMARLGFPYEELRSIKPDIVYVSNAGFGQEGPYREFKTWGPLAQAACGLAFSTGRPDDVPAAIGYSYMDHHGGNFMAIAIIAGLLHRARTGEGQWIDVSCTDAGALLNGPVLLDYTVNQRPLRRPGSPDSNRSQFPLMAPHGVYPSAGEDNWIALSCRDDRDWAAMAGVIALAWTDDARFSTVAGRIGAQDALDREVAEWTRQRDRFDVADALRHAGVPASAVVRPQERIEDDPDTARWGLWPEVTHTAMGQVRVDGIPLHFSETDWVITRGAPCLGEHTEAVICDLLGHSREEFQLLQAQGAV